MHSIANDKWTARYMATINDRLTSGTFSRSVQVVQANDIEALAQLSVNLSCIKRALEYSLWLCKVDVYARQTQINKN